MVAKATILLTMLCLLAVASENRQASVDSRPEYTPQGDLKFPAKYREWVYLSSGLDMNYGPIARRTRHPKFDNVFVNPAAYTAFMKTGRWPNGTMLVLEVRSAESRGSINKSGHYQGSEVVGTEVHVKDEKRFPGKWAFFDFEDRANGKLLPTSRDCYSCHEQHGAQDTTFVQFYPTLLEVARSKGTLSSAYTSETK